MFAVSVQAGDEEGYQEHFQQLLEDGNLSADQEEAVRQYVEEHDLCDEHKCDNHNDRHEHEYEDSDDNGNSENDSE